MMFLTNNSPFAGKEGKFVTASKIEDYLEKFKKTYHFVLKSKWRSMDCFRPWRTPFKYLIETMRREGFEFQVSRLKVIFREVNGETYEPFEEVRDAQ